MINASLIRLFFLFLTIGLTDQAFAMEASAMEFSAESAQRERDEAFRLMTNFLLTEFAIDPTGELMSADEELMQFFRDPEDCRKKRERYEVVKLFYEGVLRAIDSVDPRKIPEHKKDVVMSVRKGSLLVVKATSYDELCALRLSVEENAHLQGMPEIVDRLATFSLEPQAATPTGLSEKEVRQLIQASVSLLSELGSKASSSTIAVDKVQDLQVAARARLISVAITMRETVLQGSALESDLTWMGPQLIAISSYVTADKHFTLEERTSLSECIATILNCMNAPIAFYATLEPEELDEADHAAFCFMHCLSTQSSIQKDEENERLTVVGEFLDGIDEDLALPVSTLAHSWARNKLLRFVTILRFLLRDCDLRATINKSYPRPFVGKPIVDPKGVMQEFPALLPALQKLAKRLGF